MTHFEGVLRLSCISPGIVGLRPARWTLSIDNNSVLGFITIACYEIMGLCRFVVYVFHSPVFQIYQLEFSEINLQH
jgi:hypothetical protein